MGSSSKRDLVSHKRLPKMGTDGGPGGRFLLFSFFLVLLGIVRR